MTTSLSPQPPESSDHPTRQQLDELDALLQRMLALPVNDVEAETPPGAATPAETFSYETADNGAPAEAAAPNPTPHEGGAPQPIPPRLDGAHLSAAPRSAEEEDDASWVPLSSTWKPSPHTWKPLARSWQQPRAPRAAEPPAQDPPPPGEQETERPAAAEPPAPPPAPPAAAVDPPPLLPQPPESLAPPPWWVAVLVRLNAAFDLLLLPWGEPGRWLRRAGGRMFLGILGAALLLAAAAWAALEWFGWTWGGIFGRI